jgi:esterase/lipase superfamily enzyme
MRPFSLVVLVLCAAGVLSGCSRAPEIVGIENPDVPAASVPDVSRHRIFITTTREASEVVGALFSAERAPDLGLASVDVTIPPNHVVGQLERPERLPPDPRTEFTIIDPVVYTGDRAFIAEIDRELAKRAPGDRKVLLFVHGYNTTTSDAILLLSQFVEDTGYQGVPVLFTWASAARTPRYVYDLNSALVARVKLKEAAEVLARTRASSFDLFAHSMGGFLTMEGLVDAQQSGVLGTRKSIDHIVLASPDIDMDLFRTQVTALDQGVRDRMYLLVSRDDYALRISRRIAGGVPRVGAADAEELAQFGVTVIDLSDVEDSRSGSHSKFVGSPEVVRLIGAGIRNASDFAGASGPSLDRLLGDLPIRVVAR